MKLSVLTARLLLKGTAAAAGRLYAEEAGLQYFAASAKTSQGVSDIFQVRREELLVWIAVKLGSNDC